MAAVDIPAARPAAATAPRRQPAELPEGFWYSVKRRVLGPPLVTEQLKNQRLSRPLALGLLSCDGLSSAAYGTEEILRALRQPGRAVVQGRLRTAEVRPGQHGGTVLACEVADSTGELTAVFYGRAQIAGLEPGRRLRLSGMVGVGNDGRPAMVNPAYELLG